MTEEALSAPFWPRYLSRQEAARYLGVSASVFSQEVGQGWWPMPRLRGGKGGKLTWDRLLLDRYADQHSGIGVGEPAATGSPVPAEVLVMPTLSERMNATLPQNRSERRY
ncbi:DNA-binding protein [Acetobacter musti]|uniref:DNA-binding protein n=1 Tax=Acetobacter musti TaxID=864732 RepID=A0ABX0JJ89_9PROT|nr:DNA-binding protein [Acetobacter musti]NHN83633.1 DNA-binding protein [Acetobacter musti]